ncbi:hypothetical protein HU200_053183 [Digitaria exilis]|uniref:Uncharacterized protein n=1 Tax=Digitaria exilis TaxID=1010633 RepID=A0A835API3_9POAL|nr:hypothetical protein HU200_053183 [Digitaria exilis]
MARTATAAPTVASPRPWRARANSNNRRRPPLGAIQVGPSPPPFRAPRAPLHSSIPFRHAASSPHSITPSLSDVPAYAPPPTSGQLSPVIAAAATMSDDEPYDADGDVSRYLSCHSPEAHLFSLSEPEATTLGGLFHSTPPTNNEHAHEGNPAAAPPLEALPAPEFGVQEPITGVHGELAPDFGVQLPATEEVLQGHPAPPIIINDADHYGVPPVMNAAEHFEAPGIDVEHHQATAMDADAGQYQAMAMDVQPAMHMLVSGEMHQGYGFPADPTLVMQGNNGGVHGEHFHQAPIMDSQHYQAPTINSEHYQHRSAIIDAECHQAVPGMEIDTLAPETMMQQAYGAFPNPTPPIHHGGGGGNGVHGEHFHLAPTMDPEHREVPPGMDMAVDQPATNTLAPETMMQEAYGGFPDPTQPMQHGGGGGVDAASSLLAADSSMLPPPSPTIYTMLDELAAMLEAGGVDMGNNGGAAEADGARGVFAAADAEDDDVVFEPIVRGQLDCARCLPTREILDDIAATRKTYFAVHSTYPGTFEHAIVDSMAMGADGQFYTNELLYYDLRGRSHDWVQNFIAKNVEKMKNGGGQSQDICGPSNGGGAAACTNNNISAPPQQQQPGNNAPMEVGNHNEHMELEINMLNNILSATAEQASAANPEEAAQPVQVEENTDAPPSVVEEPVTEAAHAAGVVTQAQEKTTDAPPSVAEAAATTEAAPPESTQPSASQEQQNNAGAAPPVADVPAPVPEAAELATSRAQNNPNAGENFAAFNWEGFKQEILESSEVQPYDPASGVSVLLYPSLLEQLRQQELKRQERTRLSNMAVNDTPDYLNINDDHLANAPNFASETFRLLCLRDPTYRLYKTRVTGLCRKIKKLEQKGTQVGTGGLFAIKQKMESFKLEKEKIYATIKRAMQGNNGNPNDVVDATSNNNGEAPSNNAEPPSHDAEGPSSNVAATSNKKAKGPAAPSSAAAGPSDAAGPSGTK